MTIHTTVGLAVSDANEEARKLSLKLPTKRIMAIVNHDRYGVFVSWASTMQELAENEVECGFWRNGVKQ
jgi:hypothetical protein